MSRPKANIDPEQVRHLASIQCSYEEIALIVKCDPSTLTRRFAQVIQEGRADMKMSLKRKQYDVAMDGSVPLLIWLGKQYLGQKDNHELDLSKIPNETLSAEVERRIALLGNKNTTELPKVS